MSKGANKNDAVIEQYMQSALVKIKNLESQNHELREELNKAKNVMNKTANRFGRWITLILHLFYLISIINLSDKTEK